MYGITDSNIDAFNAFQIANNREPADSIYKIDSDDVRLFVVGTFDHSSIPLTIMPTKDDLQKLNAGAKVMLYCPHGGKPEPFIVDLNEVDKAKYTYSSVGKLDDKIMELIPPMIRWDYTQLPEHLWPHECTRHPLNTSDTMNGSWVVAIYDYGTPRQPYRNYLAKAVDDGLKAHKVRCALEKLDPETYRRGWRHSPYEGHDAYNRKEGTRKTSKGVYMGNLYQLAIAILSRRPMLDIDYCIDQTRFDTMYASAGKPGLTGDYIDPWASLVGRLPGLTEEKVRQSHGRVNVKAFTRWVLRNYKRLQPPTKQLIAARKEACWQSEVREWEDYNKEMSREFGGDCEDDSSLEFGLGYDED